MIDSKKEAMLKKIVGDMQKKFGAESVNYLGNNEITTMERLPSQCLAIDAVTGGGYPLGRMIEIFGAASSGKSTACLHAIAEAQRAFPDKFCALVDSEYSFDPVYAAQCGVNVSELLVAQPDSGTDGFAILQGFIEAGASLIVVDSVAAMVPREEAEEEDFGKSTVGLQARMMSKALRKLTPVVGRAKCVVIFTNQMRDKIGVMYGDPTTTTGGKALEYYSSIRLKFTKLGTIDNGSGDNKEKVSVRTRVEAVKNKTFPPFKRKEFIISFGKGIDNEEAIFQTILEKKMVETKGAGWFEINGEKIQGAPKLKAYFAAHPEVYNPLKEKVMEDVKNINIDESVQPDTSETED